MQAYNKVNEQLNQPLDEAQMMQLIDQQGLLMEKLDQHNAWELDHKIDRALDALRCPPDEAPISVLSGGERRCVALAPLALRARYPIVGRTDQQKKRAACPVVSATVYI